MRSITTIRKRKRPWTWTVLAAFMLVSLNVVLQPCLMAMPLSDATAESPAHHQDSPSTTDHGSHDEHADCPHCVVFGDSGCADGGACGEPNVVQTSGSVQLKDSPTKLMPMLPKPYPSWNTVQLTHIAPIQFREKPPPPGPSLMIRYCVYLK